MVRQMVLPVLVFDVSDEGQSGHCQCDAEIVEIIAEYHLLRIQIKDFISHETSPLPELHDFSFGLVDLQAHLLDGIPVTYVAVSGDKICLKGT